MPVRLCIAALALCQLAAAQADLPQEVVDQLLLRLANSTTHSAAASELLQHGRAAVPAMAKRLLAIGQENPEAWVAPSLRVLARMGPDAAAALDVLVELAEKGPFVVSALDAIGCIAPYAEQRVELATRVLEPLSNRAGRPDRSSITARLICASRLGFDASVATGDLLGGLQDENLAVRQLVCDTLAMRHRLGRLSEADRAAVCEELRKAKAGPHPRQILQAPGGGSAFAVLPGSVVERAAAIALAVLAPELPESVEGHRALLGDFDVKVQIQAARDLGVLGPAAAAATPELIAALAGDALVAREAATALGIIGVEEARVLSALRTVSRSTDAQLAARAAASLRRLLAGKR